MNNIKFEQAVDVAEKFQEGVEKLTEGLKITLKEINAWDSPNSANMVEISASQELLLCAAKQLAVSVRNALLAESELDDPRSIVLASKLALEMADNVLRSCFVDQLEKSGVNVRLAEEYALEKVRDAFKKASERMSSSFDDDIKKEIKEALEKDLQPPKDDNEDPTFH